MILEEFKSHIQLQHMNKEMSHHATTQNAMGGTTLRN